MEEKVSGIVLGGVNFGESDRILNIFTLEKGVVSAKIKGVKKAGAKLKFASEPFCFAQFILMKKGAMYTVIGASLFDSFYPVREDIVKYFCAGTVVEFLKKFYREDMVSEQSFFLAVSALKNIAYGDNPKTSLISFLVEGLKIAGYALYLNGCAECDGEVKGRVFFDYRRGGFFCEKCFDGVGIEISAFTYATLTLLFQKKLTDENVKINKVFKLLSYYCENRAEVQINSLKELIKICPD